MALGENQGTFAIESGVAVDGGNAAQRAGIDQDTALDLVAAELNDGGGKRWWRDGEGFCGTWWSQIG